MDICFMLFKYKKMFLVLLSIRKLLFWGFMASRKREMSLTSLLVVWWGPHKGVSASLYLHHCRFLFYLQSSALHKMMMMMKNRLSSVKSRVLLPPHGCFQGSYGCWRSLKTLAFKYCVNKCLKLPEIFHNKSLSDCFVRFSNTEIH